MTHRELLQKAMPLTSLSEQEWNALNDYLEKVSGNQICSILNTLVINQSRLEIISNYLDYFADKLDEKVCEVEITGIKII